MERKKLYKAKKNWVIGLATGLAIMALGTNIAYADNNTSNEPVVTTQQANTSTQQTTDQQEQVNVQPENTIGMSSNVASNPIGSYNKDNVGYANPNSEEQYYDALQEHAHHLSHQNSYKYPEKLLNKFARNDNLLKDYGTPNVYEYSNGSENPYKNVKPKQITEIKSKINTDITVHYLNNGVSNSIQITNTQGDHNYEAINSLSQALSYADYKLLTDNYSQPRNDQNYGRFFDGNKPIVTPSPMLSTQDLNALYKAAYKNRPIITFDGNVDGHHITSFLQSSIESFDDGWGLAFDNGWRGYTFMDGRQIAFVETNKTRGILRNKGKNFSWKNTVLKYFAESLAYKNSVAEEVDQNTPYMLVGRNYIPVTDILTSRTLNRLENPFNVSPTEIIFAKNGVYAIINGAMGGYNPILVQVPKEFLKSNDHNATQPSFDVQKNDQKYIIDKMIDEMVSDVISDEHTFNVIGFPTSAIGDIKDKIKKDIENKYQDKLMKAANMVADGVANWNNSSNYKILDGLLGMGFDLFGIVKKSLGDVTSNYKNINKKIEKDIEKVPSNTEEFYKKNKMNLNYPGVAPSIGAGANVATSEAGAIIMSNVKTKDNWQDFADMVGEVFGPAATTIYGLQAISDFSSSRPNRSNNPDKNLALFKNARDHDLDGYEETIKAGKALKGPLSAASKLKDVKKGLKEGIQSFKKAGNTQRVWMGAKAGTKQFDIIVGSILAAFTAGIGVFAFDFFNKKRLAARYAVKLTDDPWNAKIKQPSKQESARNNASSIGNSINGGHAGGDTKGSK